MSLDKYPLKVNNKDTKTISVEVILVSLVSTFTCKLPSGKDIFHNSNLNTSIESLLYFEYSKPGQRSKKK